MKSMDRHSAKSWQRSAASAEKYGMQLVELITRPNPEGQLGVVGIEFSISAGPFAIASTTVFRKQYVLSMSFARGGDSTLIAILELRESLPSDQFGVPVFEMAVTPDGTASAEGLIFNIQVVSHDEEPDLLRLNLLMNILGHIIQSRPAWPAPTPA
jgi:hypothetical protein